MTIIRPYTAQEIALAEKIQEAADKAKLTLSETLALNKKFGLNLQYTPPKDMVELTTYINRHAKKPERFPEECFKEAEYYIKGKGLKETIIHSSKSSLSSNVENALKKLQQVLKV